MKKLLLLLINLFFLSFYISSSAQCTAITTNAGSTNGRVYSSLPACNGLVSNMQAPPSGYLVMSNLELNGVYTVERTGGPVNDFLTARSTPTGGTVFNSGNSAMTFRVTTGTTANIIVKNGAGCGATWNGSSAILRYRRVVPNQPSTPTATYNCFASSTTLSSSSVAVSGIAPTYQWQGSNNNSTWTDIIAATGTSYSLNTATNPKYNYYRLNALYGSCSSASSSISVIPQSTSGSPFNGNVVLTQNTTIGGAFYIDGDFTINAGVTITVPDGCEFLVEANNVTINGTINAIGAGSVGGGAGSRGTSSTNLGCGSNNNAAADGGNRGADGSGAGRGLRPSSNGSDGVGCGQDCKNFDDYGGLVIGGGGSGGGGGGSYGGAGGAGGTGGNGGWFSYSNVLLNHNFIDVCTNRESPQMINSGIGSNGGSSNGTYDTPSDFNVIEFGSGGAGAGGGGRGAGLGSTSIGSGGAGGGKVTIISKVSSGTPYDFVFTGTINTNGDNGGNGGNGGNSGRTANNCCSDICNQSETAEGTNVTGGGAGAGAGGGSGGGIMFIANGNSALTGTLNARGGNGGSGGSGGASSTSNYNAGFLCGSDESINNNAGGSGNSGGAGGGGRIKIFITECGVHSTGYSTSVVAGSGAGSAGAGSVYYGPIPGTALNPGTISSDQTICYLSSPAAVSSTLPTGGVGAFTYQWYTSTPCAAATTGIVQNPSAGWSAIGGATSQNLTPAQAGTLAATTCFQLRYKSGECYKWSNVVTITVLPDFVAGTIANGNESFCLTADPSNISFSTNPSGGSGTNTYQWYYRDGNQTCPSGASTAGWTIIGGATSNSYNPPSGLTLTRTYAVQVNPAGSPDCGAAEWASNCRVVTIDASPSAAMAGANDTTCLANTYILAANNPVVGTGAWSWSGPGTVTYEVGTASDNDAQVSFDTEGLYTGTWTISNGACPNSTDDVVIGVNTPNPLAFSDVTGTCTSIGQNNWIHIYDPVGLNVIASVNDNGQILGDITASLFYHGGSAFTVYASGGTCTQQQGVMNRSFVINTVNAPGANVGIRLYFTDAELLDLISVAGCGDANGCPDDDDVCTINDLFVTQVSGAANEDGVFVRGDGTAILHTPTNNGVGNATFGGNYVEFSVGSFSEFWIHGSETGVVLPVELTNFTVKGIDNEFIQLDWQTATEINNDRFELERSINGVEFNNIGYVEGNGNTSIQHNYTFEDKEVGRNIVYYYRLKQVDFDGQFEFSNIVTASLSNENFFSIGDIVPNPSKENDIVTVAVNSNKEQKISLTIYNSIGVNVSTVDYQLKEGENSLTIEMDNLAVGTYLINFEGDFARETKKLIVVR